MALDMRRWTPGWSEMHSSSYGSSEDQVQRWMNQPGPGQVFPIHFSFSDIPVNLNQSKLLRVYASRLVRNLG